MRNRRLVVSAAIVAAAVGLVPGTASAVSVSGATTSGAKASGVKASGAKASGAARDAVRKVKGRTFSSPAERTVTTAPSGAAAKGSARAQQAPDAATAADQRLRVALNAYAEGVDTFNLETIVSSQEYALVDVVIAWGDGTTDTYNASVMPRDFDLHRTTHQYAAIGSYEIKVTVKDPATGGEAANSLTVATEGTEFTAHEPKRLLDTREGIGAARAKVGARSSVALKVAGAGKVPAGVRSVVLNLTVTNTTAPGHVSAAQEKGLAENAQTSVLNYVAGQSVPNLVIVPVGEDGYVHLFNAGWAPVDLLADVTGYFTASKAAGYGALAPTRIVDTREGQGTAKGQVPGYGSFDIGIAGRAGVPAGATAVALNLTVTNPRSAGHLTAYPAGKPAPTTSNVNFTAGQTVANAVIVPVGADGKITIRNGGWNPADVVVDVVGSYSPQNRSALVVPRVPFRILDTRVNGSWNDRPAFPLAPRSYEWLGLEGDTSTPEVDAWALNTTVTNTHGDGFLSVAPDPNFWVDYVRGGERKPQRPVSSALNWTAGATVPNLVQTPGGKGGMVDFWNQGWSSVDLVVDLTGFYETPGA
ncbi:hypothetical protein M8Z33_14250 [Streptomyces sp. ZAF1911]|uniref:hypothetical protein n=1 Tax=Streptomyces sp. ZAF1911 TaxID=2944129 RepID=UPI00237A4754|nr:hypothetical protein [Streptomyces sp. ZAF1911]MDD9377800.1 hypothetical protein [Streptomyces sp. ZAF1911]